jgi:hypothetical protein
VRPKNTFSFRRNEFETNRDDDKENGESSADRSRSRCTRKGKNETRRVFIFNRQRADLYVLFTLSLYALPVLRSSFISAGGNVKWVPPETRNGSAATAF